MARLANMNNPLFERVSLMSMGKKIRGKMCVDTPGIWGQHKIQQEENRSGCGSKSCTSVPDYTVNNTKEGGVRGYCNFAPLSAPTSQIVQ